MRPRWASACVALAAVVLVPALRRALTMSMVLVASLLLLTVAVVQPPAESHDLYSYAMNGRILEHYGDNPYTHAPANYPHDPLLAEVAAAGATRTSLYGPAFTAASAGIASVAGTDLLATRLGFQLLAAACVLALLLLLYRTTRDPVVVALDRLQSGRDDRNREHRAERRHRRARRCSPACSWRPAAVSSRPPRCSRSGRW